MSESLELVDGFIIEIDADIETPAFFYNRKTNEFFAQMSIYGWLPPTPSPVLLDKKNMLEGPSGERFFPLKLLEESYGENEQARNFFLSIGDQLNKILEEQ